MAFKPSVAQLSSVVCCSLSGTVVLLCHVFPPCRFSVVGLQLPMPVGVYTKASFKYPVVDDAHPPILGVIQRE